MATRLRSNFAKPNSRGSRYGNFRIAPIRIFGL
jgi:hypothetical protein